MRLSAYTDTVRATRGQETIGEINLKDMDISLNSIAAGALWAAGLALIVMNFFTEQPLGALGLFLAGAGGVCSIRGFFCHEAELERNAFEVGRDYERVSPIHPR